MHVQKGNMQYASECCLVCVHACTERLHATTASMHAENCLKRRRECESEALAKSLMKSAKKKMSAIQFKQALCMELLRCESIVKDTLPSIIKVWATQGLSHACTTL